MTLFKSVIGSIGLFVYTSASIFCRIELLKFKIIDFIFFIN